MSRYQYHKKLSTVVTHALLHLHLYVVSQSRFVPLATRNAMLIKWMKSRLMNRDYACVKKDLKALIQIGRKNGDIESKLWDLNEINTGYRKKLTDADELYGFLSRLFDEYGIKSHLVELGEELEPEIIYMDKSEIEIGFDDHNHQIKPLVAIMKTDNPESLLTKAKKCSELYQLELTGVEQGIAHYLISLIDKSGGTCE